MTQRGVMDQNAVVVGIDVSKNELVLCARPSHERWTSATDPGALDDVVKRLGALRPQLIVMEATGGSKVRSRRRRGRRLPIAM